MYRCDFSYELILSTAIIKGCDGETDLRYVILEQKERESCAVQYIIYLLTGHQPSAEINTGQLSLAMACRK